MNDLPNEEQEHEEFDIEAALQDDPDIKFLLPGPETEEVEDKTKPSSPTSTTLDEKTQQYLSGLQGIPLDKLKEIVERGTAQPPQREQPPQQREQAPAPYDPQAVVDQFEKDLLTDPKAAASKLLGAVGKIVETSREQERRDAEARFSSISASTNGATIDRFIERTEGDQVYGKDVASEMRKIVEQTRAADPEIISRLSGDQLSQALGSVRYQALGVVAAREKQRKPSVPAPRYATGGGGGGKSNVTNLRLTADERGLVSSLKSAGLSDADIRQAVKEYRQETGRAAS